MYKLRLLGVKSNYWCIIIPWGGSSSRTGWWLGTWPFWSLLEFLRWVGFKRGWIINQCRDGDWRRPHSMRAPKQLCLKPVLQISPGFAIALDLAHFGRRTQASLAAAPVRKLVSQFTVLLDFRSTLNLCQYSPPTSTKGNILPRMSRRWLTYTLVQRGCQYCSFKVV